MVLESQSPFRGSMLAGSMVASCSLGTQPPAEALLCSWWAKSFLAQASLFCKGQCHRPCTVSQRKGEYGIAVPRYDKEVWLDCWCFSLWGQKHASVWLKSLVLFEVKYPWPASHQPQRFCCLALLGKAGGKRDQRWCFVGWVVVIEWRKSGNWPIDQTEENESWGLTPGVVRHSLVPFDGRQSEMKHHCYTPKYLKDPSALFCFPRNLPVSESFP